MKYYRFRPVCAFPHDVLMNLRLCILVALTVLAPTPASWGQATPPATGGPQTRQQGQEALVLWKCKLPGGAYDVAVRSIISVSTHEYLVDGVARVTEVNIDTSGAMVARFYFLEPALPDVGVVPGAQTGTALIEKAEKQVAAAAEQVALDHWRKVVKNYPTTTHARTVEFRLSKKEQLAQLFKSVQTSFRDQRQGTFTAQD